MFLFSLLFSLIFVSIVFGTPCVQFLDSIVVQTDGDVVAGAGTGTLKNFLLASPKKVFVIDTHNSPVSGLPVTISLSKSVSLGALASRSIVLAAFLSSPVSAFVVPDADPTRVVIFDPTTLNTVQSVSINNADGNRFTTGSFSYGSLGQGISDVFFFSATRAVRVCMNQFNPGHVSGTSTFDLTTFGNPANVSVALRSGVIAGGGVFVSRSSTNGAEEFGDILTLLLQPNCGLGMYSQTFVGGRGAVGIGVGTNSFSKNGGHLYWLMSPGRTSNGELFQWTLDSSEARNITLAGTANSTFSPMGLAVVLSPLQSYGVVSNAVAGSGTYTLRCIGVGASLTPGFLPFAEYCRQQFYGNQPTFAMPMGKIANGKLVIASASNAQGQSEFSLVVPKKQPPTSSLIQQQQQQQQQPMSTNFMHRKRSACVATRFGFPKSCTGCSQPDAVCGTTSRCSSGCCFVTSQNGAMCCSDSPTGNGGFQCGKK